jgi:hypothetical protein
MQCFGVCVTVLWYLRATAFQDLKYRQEGQDVLEVSWRIINSSDWKLEKETADGDKVYSKKMPGVGKVLKLTVSMASFLELFDL